MAEEKKTLNFKEQHKKDVIWQIWFPVGFGAAAMLSLGIMAVFSLQSGTDSSARWGHVATMWLLLPVFFVGLISFLFLAALIFGVTKLTAILPDYSAIVQVYARLLSARVKILADRSVNPFIQIKAYKSMISRFWLALYYLILGGYSR
ncbi:hypothetical protein hrd7_21420 [Leptolinea sp. HRD-7]|nr:hypothetical protein hrd7_21420 [Leptolinea sp. HRD-7]